MAAYMIGYDLHPSRGETYDDLIEALKSYGTWWHCLDSTWIVISENTAVQIRDHLLNHIKDDDQLLVARLTGETAWFGFGDECADWLRTNLSS